MLLVFGSVCRFDQLLGLFKNVKLSTDDESVKGSQAVAKTN
jgi:hypothetical protein